MGLFDDTFVAPELAAGWARSRECPCCAGPLRPVVGVTTAPRWLCAGCDRCWALVHGHLHRVCALTCEGCATRTKATCLSLLGSQFPRFAGGLPITQS
jgi:hypothetical protein